VFPGIGRKILLLNARLVVQGADLPRIVLLSIEDVTDRRLMDRRLANQRRELQRSTKLWRRLHLWHRTICRSRSERL
jgi:hypothetical protein